MTPVSTTPTRRTVLRTRSIRRSPFPVAPADVDPRSPRARPHLAAPTPFQSLHTRHTRCHVKCMRSTRHGPILTPTASASTLYTVPHPHAASTSTSHPSTTHAIARSARCRCRALSITQRALRSSHYASAYSVCAGRVQCAVGDTAARQLPYPRTAPRHRVFVFRVPCRIA
jgi:hypothetical protein